MPSPDSWTLGCVEQDGAYDHPATLEEGDSVPAYVFAVFALLPSLSDHYEVLAGSYSDQPE